MHLAKMTALVAALSLGLGFPAKATMLGLHPSPRGSGLSSAQNKGATPRPKSQEPQKTQQKEKPRQETTSNTTAVQEALRLNPNLGSKLQALLGPQVDLQQAAGGFDDLHQFVAAVHLSKNLDVPFGQLKTAVEADGTLSKAVHSVKPNLPDTQVRDVVKMADREAQGDISDTNNSSPGTNDRM